VLALRMDIGEPPLNSPTSDNWFFNAARTIGRGFLLGLGFGAALGCIYYVAYQLTIKNVKEEVGLSDSDSQPNKEIVLSDVEEQKHDGATAIIGKATNSGKKAVRGIHIQANLFNRDKFVDQYSTYITGTLAPGKFQYFKISCGCKDTPPAEHDSYKLEILNGY
jgi:hypothetical protein